MENKIRNFIKTDLHLHLDGAVEPKTLFELGTEREIDLPADNLEAFIPFVAADPDCRSVNEYLEKFALPTKILQDKSALHRIAKELVERLDRQFIGYAEIRFAPQLHTKKGMTQSEAVEAVIDGIGAASRNNGVKTGLILCAMSWGDAKKNKEENLETVDVAKQ
ncbi:MAG: adenosine deaminase, partial [Oscillospiraceae bacterium]|nr:adenosine deaminase [Oscillospiraceae bacterium]